MRLCHRPPRGSRACIRAGVLFAILSGMGLFIAGAAGSRAFGQEFFGQPLLSGRTHRGSTASSGASRDNGTRLETSAGNRSRQRLGVAGQHPDGSPAHYTVSARTSAARNPVTHTVAPVVDDWDAPRVVTPCESAACDNPSPGVNNCCPPLIPPNRLSVPQTICSGGATAILCQPL